MMKLDGNGNGAAAVKSRSVLDESLPPIFHLPEMFADLVNNVAGRLTTTVDTLKGRALRVGTMCR